MATPETKFRRHFVAAAVLLGMAVQPLLAQVPELETIFYGRIVNRTTGQEYQVTSGTLSVTVSGAGVAPLEVTAQLQPHDGGKYSYVLKMPHQAKSLDLTVDGGKLPLHTADTGFENVSMKVNGHAARPFGNGPTSFVASQPKRGGVHRLDLELFNPLEDTDGDGMPDWWEDLHDLDKQDASDALLRWGDNHYTYLDAFRLGLTPQADDRLPELLTSELMVVENGASGLLPRSISSASTPAQIDYHVVTLPAGGDLVLRNARPDPKRPDRVLKTGDSFSQADVNAGRVEFVHNDPSVSKTVLQVTISNNNPDLEAVEGEIELIVFKPDATEGRAGEKWLESTAAAPAKKESPLDIWRRRATESFSDEWTGGARQRDWIAAFLLARQHGYTIWDGTKELPVRDLRVPSAGMIAKEYQQFYLRQYGQPRKHVIFAGNGTSRAEGGMNADVLIAGRGETTLRGNGGADFFTVSEGITIIEDFKSAEGDLLDLSPLLQGWPGLLQEKVHASFNAGNTWLRVPLGANQEAVVILQGLNLTDAQLEALRRKGSVFGGAISNVAYATNRAPMAVADEGYVVAGAPVAIAVLANDYDPDGDSLSIKSVTQGTAGTVQISNGILVYNPSPAFNGADTFSYTIEDGQGGFTTGIVRISYPFPAAAGTYTTFVFADDGTPLGQLKLTLQRSGGFSVALTLGAVKYSGKAIFDGDGAALVTLKSGKASLELQLNLDLSDPSYPLTGHLIETSGGGTLAVSVVAANPQLAPATAKRFTLVAQPPEGPAEISGYSIATIAVSNRYVATVAGKLADGTAFTGSTVQDKTGAVIWLSSLYKKTGWVLGQLSLADGGGLLPYGTLKWAKPIDAEPAVAVTLEAAISAFVAPSVATVSVLDFPNDSDRRADLRLIGGGLADGIELEIRFQTRDLIGVSEPIRKLQLNRTTGAFTGTVVIDGLARTIQGAVLQNQDLGFGFFLNGPSSGPLTISPK